MQASDRTPEQPPRDALSGGPSPARPLESIERAPHPASGRVETLLVVDDDDGVRKLISRVLEMQGFDVLAAPDGASALDLVRDYTGRLDLAVCDINMPGLSGGRLVAELATLRPDLTFVYISGYRVESPRELTLADGAGRPIPFLSKPFSPTDLVLAVRGALDRRRLTSG